MKRIKVIIILASIVLTTSCTPQKTIQLANGEVITEKKLDRLTRRAERRAKRAAYKSVKGRLSKKQVNDFMNSTDTNISIDTLNK